LLTTPSTPHNIELFCGSVNEAAWHRLRNDFEPMVFFAFRHLAEAKRGLLRSGALLASLSGSGSAVFGIFEDYWQAREAAQRIQRPGYKVFVTRTVSRREFQGQLPETVRPSQRIIPSRPRTVLAGRNAVLAGGGG